jgi:4-hydroxy-tetrahydrodipicolinate reductase
MITRILLHGCNGKMGKVISQALEKNDTCLVVAGIDINTRSDFGYPVFSTPGECNADFDVIIDFSTMKALPAIVDFAKSSKKGIVIATTGLTEEYKYLYKALSLEVPVFVSANMSLGINILISLAQKATAILSDNFDIEIIEAHHNMKIDAPSGTALMIADSINETVDGRYNYEYDRHANHEARTKNEIGIHAIRGGTIVGDHTVLFAGSEEVLEITHRAQSRNVFAQGAIAAAKFIAFKEPGLYSMKELIDSKK